MIYNVNQEATTSTQEAMEMKLFDEKYAHIAPSKYEIGLEGALMHIYENERNFTALMKSIGIAEVKYYNKYGSTLFEDAASTALTTTNNTAAKTTAKEAVSKIIDGLIQWIRTAIEKIIASAKSFKQQVIAYCESNREFIEKYEKSLSGTTVKEFTGWKFPELNDITPSFNQDKLVDLINDNVVHDDNKKHYNVMRSDILGVVYDGDSFSKACMVRYFGSASKQTLTNVKCNEQLAIMKNGTLKLSMKAIALAKAAHANSEKLIGIMNKSTNIKEISDNWTGTVKAAYNDFTMAYHIYMKAIHSRVRQAKAICIKSLQENNIDTAKNESAVQLENKSIEELFASVQLI